MNKSQYQPAYNEGLLSIELCNALEARANVVAANYLPTCPTRNADQFFNSTGSTPAERVVYSSYLQGTVRLEVVTKQVLAGGTQSDRLDVLYICFRNGKDKKTHTYARPSSVEVGYVDGNNQFVGCYKKHYKDYYGNDDLIATDLTANKALMKQIRDDIAAAVAAVVTSRGAMLD